MAEQPERRSATIGPGPSAGSATPMGLVAREDLGRDEKLERLRQWELDLRERMVAEEENMAASEPLAASLDEVLDALRVLGAESQFHDVTTKHG